jgi:mRNA-degrading endonuclease toxin of MazEF toxin-antitoxin module
MSEVKQGDLYWCEPDPEDTVGSEQEGDRIWVIVSIPPLHRGNCVVELPLSRHTEKAVAHLIQVPKAEITMVDNNPAINRVALTDQIRALDKTRFRKKAGYVSRRALVSIINLGLGYLFGTVPIPRREPRPAQLSKESLSN